MRESHIEKTWRKHYKNKGWLMLKWVSPGFTGVPDRIVLGPGPTFFLLSSKRREKNQLPDKIGYTTFCVRLDSELR